MCIACVSTYYDFLRLKLPLGSTALVSSVAWYDTQSAMSHVWRKESISVVSPSFAVLGFRMRRKLKEIGKFCHCLRAMEPSQ